MRDYQSIFFFGRNYEKSNERFVETSLKDLNKLWNEMNVEFEFERSLSLVKAVEM